MRRLDNGSSGMACRVGPGCRRHTGQFGLWWSSLWIMEGGPNSPNLQAQLRVYILSPYGPQLGQ